MEDFVTYEQAVQLKELGFNWPCYRWYHYYPNNEHHFHIADFYEHYNHNDSDFASFSAPTLAQVQKWLREKHYLSIEIYTSLDINSNWEWDGFVKNLNDTLEDEIEDTAISCKTYEEALSTCIDKAIEILINKNK